MIFCGIEFVLFDRCLGLFVFFFVNVKSIYTNKARAHTMDFEIKIKFGLICFSNKWFASRCTHNLIQ